MKNIITIPLYNGKTIVDYAIIDYEDYPIVNKIKWYIDQKNRIKYAGSNSAKNNKYIFMHRLVMKAEPNQIVDHINGYGLDNRKCNLRLCTDSLNGLYFRHKQHNTSSKYIGVSWNKAANMWKAYIMLKGTQYHLGYFYKEELAFQVYLLAKNNYLEHSLLP